MLTVVDHAVQRYCERVLNLKSDSLSPAEIEAIEAEIAENASLPDAPELQGLRTWTKTTAEAVYLVRNRHVVTIISRDMYILERRGRFIGYANA